MFFVSSALIAARNLWSDVSEGFSGLNNMLLGHIKHGILSQSDHYNKQHCGGFKFPH